MTTLIGRRWNCGNAWSRPVLIGRGLGYLLVFAMEFSQSPIQVLGGVVRGMVFGGDSDRVTPVPIPNTEVKPVSADGTWVDSPWESRTSPDFLVGGQISFGWSGPLPRFGPNTEPVTTAVAFRSFLPASGSGVLWATRGPGHGRR
jgi:hypothetical protein